MCGVVTQQQRDFFRKYHYLQVTSTTENLVHTAKKVKHVLTVKRLIGRLDTTCVECDMSSKWNLMVDKTRQDLHS